MVTSIGVWASSPTVQIPAQGRGPASRCHERDRSDEFTSRRGLDFPYFPSGSGRHAYVGVPAGGRPRQRAPARLRGPTAVVRLLGRQHPTGCPHPVGRGPWTHERTESVGVDRSLLAGRQVALALPARGELLGFPAPPGQCGGGGRFRLSLIHISEPTR